MKSSKAEIRTRTHKIPVVRFQENRGLTSYGGLVVVQALFNARGIKERIRKRLGGFASASTYGATSILMVVLVGILLGCRRLRDLDFMRDDPLLPRVVGLRTLPSISTVSRTLSQLGKDQVEGLQEVQREMVLERLAQQRFPRITADFDGSVLTTTGHAEGSAVGFNKKKKGARSYYPLFCTIAQTDQFLANLHRPGNVHDSNGAAEFVRDCSKAIRERLPRARLESRFDSAFFQEGVFQELREQRTEFSCSVPFERFPQLKRLVEERKRWRTIDTTWSFFETEWKPKSWGEQVRILLVRQRRPVRSKEPVQLDLFIPKDHVYEYTAIATNKTVSASAVVAFHHGRGGQEKLIGNGKQHAALDVVATKRRAANETFTILSAMAHNLSRELQMTATPPDRGTEPKRPPWWRFQSLGTIRQRLLHRAGILTRPQGELTLTMNDNVAVETDMRRYLDALAA